MTDLHQRRHLATLALQTASEDHDEAAWKAALQECERLRREWEGRQRWEPLPLGAP